MRREDAAFIYHLYMHPAVNPFLLYEPMDGKAFEPIFDDLLSKEIIYIYEDKGKPAGMFKLLPLTHRTTHIVYLGGLAIEPSLAGQGLGKQMLSEIIELCKAKGFLRIELSTATINERAIRLYEKAGFQKEGVLRNYTWLKSEDRFLDEVMMSYLF
jgi:RimJ/RimL family protein N-acetyltransferase